MSARQLTLATGLTWPLGLVLVTVNMEVDAVTLPVFVALSALYAAGVLGLLRAWGAHRHRTAALLVASAPGLFALVGFAGPPTADEPELMQVNTAALAILALVLLLVAIRLVVDHRTSPHFPVAVSGLVLLVMGSMLYLANLVARVAVVLSGAADQQAAVEDHAWVAYEYLRGLEGSPDYLSYLLVWFDLTQLGYVAVTYVAFAGIARLLQRGGSVSHRAGTVISRAAYTLASVLILSAVAAMVLPREADLVPAWAAFVTSIPFMTTLVPFALGLAMLSSGRPHDRSRDNPGPSPRTGRGPTTTRPPRAVQRVVRTRACRRLRPAGRRRPRSGVEVEHRDRVTYGTIRPNRTAVRASACTGAGF